MSTVPGAGAERRLGSEEAPADERDQHPSARPLSSDPSSRLRVRLRSDDTTPVSPPNDGAPSVLRPELVASTPRIALLAAALALAATSRGDVVVLALLLGFAVGTRLAGLASGAALAAAMVRWGSPGLGAIAGAQAVLGPAGWTGSSFAVASAWLGALALILAAVSLDRSSVVVTAVSVAPFAVAATDLVVGPAPGGALALRVLATAIAIAVTTVLSRWRSMPAVAAAAGVLALVCAGIAR